MTPHFSSQRETRGHNLGIINVLTVVFSSSITSHVHCYLFSIKDTGHHKNSMSIWFVLIWKHKMMHLYFEKPQSWRWKTQRLQQKYQHHYQSATKRTNFTDLYRVPHGTKSGGQKICPPTFKTEVLPTTFRLITVACIELSILLQRTHRCVVHVKLTRPSKCLWRRRVRSTADPVLLADESIPTTGIWYIRDKWQPR